MEKVFVYVQPYIEASYSYVKILTPFFVLMCFIIVVFNIWLKKNQDVDLIKHLFVPLMISACIFYYDVLIITLSELNDILFGSLPQPKMPTIAEIWEVYKSGFGDSVWSLLMQGMNIFSTVSTFIVVKLMGFVKSLIGSVQLFFKIILIMVGPWAFLFSIIPGWRKIIQTWFKYFVYFSLWSVSIFVIDSLALGILKGIILDGNPTEENMSSTAERIAINAGGASVGYKGKKAFDKAKKTAEKIRSVKGASSVLKEVKTANDLVKTGKTVKKGAKVVKAGKDLLLGIAKRSPVGMVAGILAPVLILFLYFMVPSITRFFFMTTGMETVLTAGVAFMTSKVGAMSKFGQKAGGKASKVSPYIDKAGDSLRSRVNNMQQNRMARKSSRHISNLNNQIQNIRSNFKKPNTES